MYGIYNLYIPVCGLLISLICNLVFFTKARAKNKETAIQMLKAKLYQREIEKQNDQLASIKGEQTSINFGSQIRSYILEPYKLVKDYRSNYETSQVDKVLDGDITEMILSILKSKKRS